MKAKCLTLTSALLLFNLSCVDANSIHDRKDKADIYPNESITLSSLFEPIAQTEMNFGVSSLRYTFSGATASSINLVQLCYATDNLCNNCGVPFKTITNGTPLTYTPTGTTYSVSPASLAAYLRSSGFSGSGTPTYNVGMYVQSTDLNCLSSSAYCSTTTSTNNYFLCMQATFDGTNVTALSQSDNGNVVLNQNTPQYAYVAAYFQLLYRCTLNSNGTLNTCALTPSSSAPWRYVFDTAFATFNNTEHAYVSATSNDGTFTGLIYQCKINTDGTLDTCAATPTAGSQLWASPNSVTFATVNQTAYAYVTDRTNNFYQCTLDNNGGFNVCAITPSSGALWTQTYGAAFGTINSTQYAYVTDTSNVFQCTLDATGKINTCVTTPSTKPTSWHPKGLSVTTVNGTQYAYVVDSSHVYQCTLNADGSFNTCQTTPSSGEPAWFPRGVSLATKDNTQYAYVADSHQPGNIYQCSLYTNGTFNTCTLTPSTGAPSWSPYAVTLPTT